MDERAFVYWLNGFFELSEVTTLSARQIEIIKQHLALVKHTQNAAPVFDWSEYGSPYVSPYTVPNPKWIISPDVIC